MACLPGGGDGETTGTAVRGRCPPVQPPTVAPPSSKARALLYTWLNNQLPRCSTLMRLPWPCCPSGFVKPDPRAFQDVLAHFELQPHEMLHVGDDPRRDYFGARGSGAHGLLLERKERPAPEGVPSSHIVRDLKAVLPMVAPVDP